MEKKPSERIKELALKIDPNPYHVEVTDAIIQYLDEEYEKNKDKCYLNFHEKFTDYPGGQKACLKCGAIRPI